MQKSTLVVGMALAILLGVFVLALPGCGGAGGSSGGPYYRFSDDADPNNIPVGVYVWIQLINGWSIEGVDPWEDDWVITSTVEDMWEWYGRPSPRDAVIYTKKPGRMTVSLTVNSADANRPRDIVIHLRVVAAT